MVSTRIAQKKLKQSNSQRWETENRSHLAAVFLLLVPCAPIVAAENLGAVSPPVVHSATKAVLELFTAGADSFAGPVAVAEDLEFVFPDFIEIVCVDIALGEDISVYVRAGTYPSVYQDRCYVDASVAEVSYGADLFLVFSKISLTAEGNLHRSFLAAFCGDEIHHPDHLLV